MTEFATLTIEEPIDLVKLCINEYVYIKLRHERELKGKLHVSLINILNLINYL